MQITKTRLKQIQKTTLFAVCGFDKCPDSKYKVKTISTNLLSFRQLQEEIIDKYNQQVERRMKMDLEPMQPRSPEWMRKIKRRQIKAAKRKLMADWFFVAVLGFLCGVLITYFGLK